jgi:class 3 adenylate cyclase
MRYSPAVSNIMREPQHYAIVTIDIEGFGSPTRTDPIRASLRSSLERIIKAAIEGLAQPEPTADLGDTGDGKWILFNPSLPKSQLITILAPRIETELRHHNLRSSTAAQLRLRIGIHHGELVPDESGYSGEALNHAFRIIDNDVVRQALKASCQNSILAVSSDFYEKIVRPGYASLIPDAFSPVRVKSKETVTVVWLNSPIDPASTTFSALSRSQAILTGDRAEQRILTLSDLPPASLYVPITDIHNTHLYERDFPGAPIQQHIETALLLADKVVIHCADPYRSAVVANVLSDLEPCIEAGDLLFLLGENAQDPWSHFRSYIDYKVSQYEKSKYGKRDVISLTHVDDDAADRAERLLRLSPFALIRGFTGTDGFIRTAKADLQTTERITIREHFATSVVGRLSLTLRQLLDLTELGHDGELRRCVADEETIGRLQVEVNRLATHNSFSRQILLEAIRRHTSLDVDKPLDQIFEERVSLVHLIGTVQVIPHTEVTNRRDRVSQYYFGHLMDHLSMLAEVQHPTAIGPSLVLELRALPNWWAFAAYHIRLVADSCHRQVVGENAIDLESAYRWSRRIPEFSAIRAVVRKHWK